MYIDATFFRNQSLLGLEPILSDEKSNRTQSVLAQLGHYINTRHTHP